MDEIVRLISEFETAEGDEEKREVLELVFGRFHQYPMIMRSLFIMRSLIQERLLALYPYWPRASYHHKVLLGCEI